MTPDESEPSAEESAGGTEERPRTAWEKEVEARQALGRSLSALVRMLPEPE